MSQVKYKIAKGFSLIEVVVALVIIAVAAAGTFSCEFYIVKQFKSARAQVVAARTAQLLIEDWKANKGSPSYDPTSLNLGFSFADGRYLVVIDNLPLYFSLVTADVDTAVNPPLRQITVTTQWRDDYSDEPPAEEDSKLVLTTYCK